MNTQADSASTLLAALPIHAISDGTQSVEATRTVQVLSASDEAFYRAIFAAQARGDWAAADDAIERVSDKELIGHVLADRYERRQATAAELESWLASYSHLPEAGDIYEEARDLPAAKGGKIEKPDLSGILAGGDSYGSSFGFRTESADKYAQGSSRFLTKVIRALHHSNPNGAEAILDAEIQLHPLPADEVADIRGRIAAAFFYAGVTEHAHDLAVEAAPSGNPLALWIAGLTEWNQGDAHAAADDFVKLASEPGLSPPDKSAASFWAWRALTRIGDKAEARNMLDQAAKQPRNFYGLLAASLVGNETVWSWDLPSLNTRNIGILEKIPAGWRALALIQVGQKSLAESELRHLNTQGHRELQSAMLALAENHHMPSLAVQLGGLTSGENGKRYDAALYPVPPWQPEQGFQVDRALIYALMRRESFFDPTAVSNRGACGLMQVMPDTANLVARHKVSDDGDCSGRMLDPSYNMALGQEYVRRLSQQPMIGDNLLFLLAAYNGGPGKLAHWREGQVAKDPLLFVESLPLHETRDYVQQVMMHYWTYRARLDESVDSMAGLARGEWPRYALTDETAPSGSLKMASIQGFEVASSFK